MNAPVGLIIYKKMGRTQPKIRYKQNDKYIAQW